MVIYSKGMSLGVLLFYLGVVNEVVNNYCLLGLYMDAKLVYIYGLVLILLRYHWCVVIIIIAVTVFSGGEVWGEM